MGYLFFLVPKSLALLSRHRLLTELTQLTQFFAGANNGNPSLGA